MSYPPPQPPHPTNPRPQPPPSPRPKTVEELLPVSELAKLWRCSEDHIMHLVTRGELRSVQLGIGRAKTRIPASAAAEFIAKRTAPARTRKLHIA